MAAYGKISARRWLKLACWTLFGTAGCLAVSIGFNWLAFRNMEADAFRQGLISATVLPIILAGPLFFFLTLKLRELAIANHKLNELASLDGLTGCLNRRAFTSLVEKNLDDERRGLQPTGGALLVVDADKFKSINDSFGHDQGDDALRLIAASICSALRADDVVGRMGGEEFSIHLPGVDERAAADLAERIRVAVHSAPFAPNGRPYPLSVSVGCAVYERSPGFRALFSLADQRLYEAKEQGRDRIRLTFVPPLVPVFDDRTPTNANAGSRMSRR